MLCTKRSIDFTWKTVMTDEHSYLLLIICVCSFIDFVDLSLSTKVTGIQANTFYGCTMLSEIKLPNQLKSIGMNCFSGCASLGCLTFYDTLNRIDKNCFTGCNLLREIFVVSQSMENFKKVVKLLRASGIKASVRITREKSIGVYT